MPIPDTLTRDEPVTAPTTKGAPKPRERQLFRSEGDASLLLSVLLALGTVVLYARSLGNGFVSLDDRLYVTQNPNVLQGLTWRGFLWAMRTSSVDYWHPLTWLVHMADVQMFGLRPAGHHLVSLLLHVFNIVLLFQLLRKATGRVARSAIVAALFAVFPLNVESVAWVAETKTLLCTALLLLALWAYGAYVRRPGIFRYLAVCALFGLGLMAKPMLVTFPVILLVVDYWPLQRLMGRPSPTERRESWLFAWGKIAAEKIPFFAMACASVYSTIVSQRVVGAVVTRYPISWRLKTAIWSYADYLFKALWPAHLAAFYPYEGRTLSAARVAAAGILLLAISALAWRFRQKRYLLAGWLWYLITLLPVIGIVQSGSQGMADRYAYIPFWGIFVAAVWLAADLATAVSEAHAKPDVRPLLAGGCAAILVALSVVTFAQIRVWHDSYALYSHAAKVVPHNAFAEENLGEVLMDQGEPQQALVEYEAAARDMPDSSIVHYNLGAVLQSQDRLDDAAREYKNAIIHETAAPMLWNEYDNLGGVFARMNRLDDADAAFSAAIKVEPGDMQAYKNRGLVEYAQGNFPAARADFAQAVRLTPDAQTYYWLGRLAESAGSPNEAAADYQSALRLEPNFDAARKQLEAPGRK
ncbi:MAG TPA: tetratricopeptide repeat protein [Candidatus Aquilonibacter sp.]|nr:tetratricopeptide repeat protein [Candidatus Aquilonibacter sp.]